MFLVAFQNVLLLGGHVAALIEVDPSNGGPLAQR